MTESLPLALLQGLVRMAADEPVDSGLPVPLPLLLSGVGLITAVAGALVAGLTKRWRTPADDREDRRVGIEADERLLKRFEDMLKERDGKIEALGQRIEELDTKVEGYRQERNVLIDFIYALVRIVRELGGIDQIPAPPLGIFISGHPSNQPQEAPRETV